MKNGTQSRMVLPKQMLGDKTELTLDTTFATVNSAAKGVMLGNLVLTIFFALSFKSMWYLLSVM